jgi:hypothetical protein
MRAKVTVRAKRAQVNSVFLVQLRKKGGADFPNWNIGKMAWRRVIFALDGGNFVPAKRSGKIW